MWIIQFYSSANNVPLKDELDKESVLKTELRKKEELVEELNKENQVII